MGSKVYYPNTTGSIWISIVDDSTYDEICEKLNDDKVIVVARIADTRGAETLISS